METKKTQAGARIHPDKAWLNYHEASIMSGWSRSTISRLVRSERLQHARIGTRGVRVKRAALEALMENGGVSDPS